MEKQSIKKLASFWSDFYADDWRNQRKSGAFYFFCYRLNLGKKHLLTVLIVIQRFPLELRVWDSPADDEICIPGCKIGSRSVVRFRLFGENIAFTAKLLEHAEKEASLFEISPEEGILTPDGLEFSIIYTPRIFGEKASARLLVLTSDRTVKYLVKI